MPESGRNANGSGIEILILRLIDDDFAWLSNSQLVSFAGRFNAYFSKNDKYAPPL